MECLKHLPHQLLQDFFLSATFTVTFQHHLTQGFSRLSYQVETLDHDFLTAVVTCDSVTKVRMLMATMNTSGFSRFNFTWQIFYNFQQLKARSSLSACLSYQLSMGRLKTMSDKTSNANLSEGDPPQLNTLSSQGSSNPQIWYQFFRLVIFSPAKRAAPGS